MSEATKLQRARQAFVAQWGVLGSSWGVNRSVAQVHALLLVSHEPLSQDDVMEELAISRGNVATSLRELVDWGLVRPVVTTGERRYFYEAEKDVWKIACNVARERSRREIEPVVELLRQLAADTAGSESAAAKHFHKQVGELLKYAEMAKRFLESFARREKSVLLPRLLRLTA
jgi:DNA-binding transcriptional regulator GbsR (MarR family)